MKMIQLRCPNCEAFLEFEDDIGSTCYCKYCGTRILLDEQQDSVVNAKVRLKELNNEKYKIDKELNNEKYKIDKEYEDLDKERQSQEKTAKYPYKVTLAIFLVIIFLFTAGIIYDEITFKVIPVPYSASDFRKMDYEKALMILEEAGYKNITVLENTSTGLFKSKDANRVSSISIDGKKNFKSGKVFNQKANVVITYNGET